MKKISIALSQATAEAQRAYKNNFSKLTTLKIKTFTYTNTAPKHYTKETILQSHTHTHTHVYGSN